MQNLVYGVTEQELRTWPMQQYLMKVPQREFENNVDQGFWMNLQGSLMACFGVGGFESEQGWGYAPENFPEVDKERNYRTNWDRAVIYMVPQLPFHHNRDAVLEIMIREEPRMIQMFRLQAQMRAEVMAEPGSEQLNEFQLQQKLAMKMQAHMMKNMPQMMPSTEQQKAIQLQMLGHMKRELANEPQLAKQAADL